MGGRMSVYIDKIVPFYVETAYLVWNNNSNSGYSNYVLNTGHTYATRIDNIDVIKI
jgi:hypothetical protein